PGGTPTPFSWSVSSEMEDGWDVTTSSRRPEAIFYLMRRPRGARFTHQGMRPAELLQVPLAQRSKLQNELGLNLLNKCDLQAYVAAERRVMMDSRVVLKKKNPFAALWEVLRFMVAPKKEWSGERGVRA
ncbi:MAG TPA: hypothetical protein VNA16_06630, partial [Abditibacteriaceae bacterium]|nr:hypothetical protein [Abditibacteriaceae bacterium]